MVEDGKKRHTAYMKLVGDALLTNNIGLSSSNSTTSSSGTNKKKRQGMPTTPCSSIEIPDEWTNTARNNNTSPANNDSPLLE
jgi:hypothetical protein